jgi:hypothetical protein
MHMASSDTDEESGGIQAGAASPRGRARGSTPQTLSEQDRAGAFTRPGPDEVDGDDDDDDDGVGPASEGACGIWVGLLARTLLSVVSALVSAALVVLYPLYLLTPTIVTDLIFKGVFRIGCVTPGFLSLPLTESVDKTDSVRPRGCVSSPGTWSTSRPWVRAPPAGVGQEASRRPPSVPISKRRCQPASGAGATRDACGSASASTNRGRS